MKTKRSGDIADGDFGVLSNLRHDIPGGVVVFLVAIPLCLGIALASGAPRFAGLIAGIIIFLKAVREQTDLLRPSLIGQISRSLSLNRPTIHLK
jgi:Sulfate permease family